jgi:hypothetical protein
MNCPFCHYELDIEEASCANCGAALQRGTLVPFGIKLRTLGFAGAMLLLTSMILSTCVLNYLPGNIHSGFQALKSPQQPLGPAPDLRSADLQGQVLNWQHGASPSQNPILDRTSKRPLF